MATESRERSTYQVSHFNRGLNSKPVLKYAFMNAEILHQITTLTSLSIPEKANREELENQLAVYINDLIVHDFQRLISILYRIDVNEVKLRNLLKTHPDTKAGIIIARLIIERQEQKIESREAFRKGWTDDQEEKW